MSVVIHPQPSIYEQVAADLNFDPMVDLSKPWDFKEADARIRATIKSNKTRKALQKKLKRKAPGEKDTEKWQL